MGIGFINSVFTIINEMLMHILFEKCLQMIFRQSRIWPRARQLESLL